MRTGILVGLATVVTASTISAQQPYIINDEYTGFLQVYIQPQEAHEQHTKQLAQMEDAGVHQIREETRCVDANGDLQLTMSTEVTVTMLAAAKEYLKDEQLRGVERNENGFIIRYEYTSTDPVSGKDIGRVAHVSGPNGYRHLAVASSSDDGYHYSFWVNRTPQGSVRWISEEDQLWWRQDYTYDSMNRLIRIDSKRVIDGDTIYQRIEREFGSNGLVELERQYGSLRIVNCAAGSTALAHSVGPAADGLFLYQEKRYFYE